MTKKFVNLNPTSTLCLGLKNTIFHAKNDPDLTPIFAILGPIFRCSKSIPCRSKSDRSRRFSNQILISMAQNVALVHLPHDRAVLHKYFVEKISENPKSKSVRFIVPPLYWSDECLTRLRLGWPISATSSLPKTRNLTILIFRCRYFFPPNLDFFSSIDASRGADHVKNEKSENGQVNCFLRKKY